MQNSNIEDALVLGWPGIDHFDATYSNLSRGDIAFLRTHNKLQSILYRAAGYRLGEKTTALRSVSPDLASYAQGKQAVYFPDLVSPIRAIYLGRQVGPADAVDTLVHEFGHILFDDLLTNFFQGDETLVYHKNATHDESCAEVLSWITLSDIYTDYPEIEVLHIIKLYGFSQLKPFDNHYVGFGSVLPLILKPTISPTNLFVELSNSVSLQAFLKKNKQPDLVPTEQVPNILGFRLP